MRSPIVLPLFPVLILIVIIVVLVRLRDMGRRVDGLERELKAMQARMADGTVLTAPPDVDAETGADPTLAAPAMAAPVIAQGNTGDAEDMPVAAMVTATEPSVATEPAEPTPLGQTLATDAMPAQEERESLESWLGARWAVWIGGVALAFGGLFLVKYSIEAGLLGPAARLGLAILFGLVLIAAGELVRRRAMPHLSARFGNAMIPGALTAAGAVTLMGAVWASYAVYGYIGPTPAFLALAMVSLATIALSLLHGQALAGLGLLASLVTPALVATENPSANALFGFLVIVWLAVNAASRLRQWIAVPALANIGLGLWAFVFLAGSAHDASMLPATLALLVMLAGTCFLWPSRHAGLIGPERPGVSRLFGRRPLKITLSASLVTVFFALAMLASEPLGAVDLLICATVLLAALAGFGAIRTHAAWAAVLAALGAVIGMAMTVSNGLDAVSTALDFQPLATVATAPTYPWLFLLLGAAFPALGFVCLQRYRRSEPDFATLWAFLMPTVPVAIATISFVNIGNLNRDWTHGLYAIGLGVTLLAAAEWLFRGTDEAYDTGRNRPGNLLVAGSFAGFALALHTLTNGIVTTILLSALGFLYVSALRIRAWPALPWMMAAATLIVFGRIAWEPTVIGANSLGTTPFLNALLPGYGIPTLLAIAAAWMLRNADNRIRNIMQALASLSALITVAVLVRHAMNGGTLQATVPTLGEQSLYTLITVGFSGILMMLDLRSPSPVFRYGSMIAGVLATANVLALHLVGLNPYLTGESTGPWPFVNLLLLGYLLPALSYALVAYLARERRPKPYVLMLAIAGGVLGFAWATLSVRRFWQGENIADWKGFVAAETYTYSVVWLLLGILALVLGSRFNLRSLRIASAVLVLVAVLKVFLVDMSNLEGILRALSFMGLGAVLIGIGLFYQRVLGRKDGGKRPNASAAPTEGTPA